MPTLTVSSAAELKSALSSLVNGGAVQLRPGDYGDLDIRDFNPSGIVSISSVDPDHAAHLDTVNILRSSNVKFSSLDIGRPLNSGEPDYKNFIYAEKSTRLSFANLFVHGSLDGNPGNDGQGLVIRSSNLVTITQNRFEDLHRAVAVSMTDNVLVTRNNITMIAEDGIGFAQVKNVEVSGNLIGNFHAIKGHPDAIQFGTTGTTESSQSVVIRDNVVLQGAGEPMQGLFMRDEIGTLPFKNVTVSNNLFYTDQYNGIVLQHAESVNIVANSTISVPGDGVDNRIWLKDVDGASISNNVADAYILFNVSSLYLAPNNVDLSKGVGSAVFPNLSAGPHATIDDLLTTGGYHPGGQKADTPAPVSDALGSWISNKVQSSEASGQVYSSYKVAAAEPAIFHADAHHAWPTPVHYPWMDNWHLA